MLVSLRPMQFGEEVTFDYFAGSKDDDQAGCGKHRSDMHLAAMAGRLMNQAGKGDQHKRYAFEIRASDADEDSESDFEFAQHS